MDEKELVKLALRARTYSYCPYSHFAVGAALLAKNGNVFTGCNIENAGYTPTSCAERTAFFKAVSEGVLEFEAIAIVGGPEGEETTEFTGPCGVCRQVMMEFCSCDTFQIILGKSNLETKVYSLRELLPEGFGPGSLKDTSANR